MKRKLTYLALPLVFATLIFAAKWRVDHPTPSQSDLAVRAAIIASPYGYVTFLPPGGHPPLAFPPPANYIPLTRDQTKRICSALFRGPGDQSRDFTGFGPRGGIRLVWYYKGSDNAPRRLETDYATRRLEIDLATSEATFTYGDWFSPRWCILPISERHVLEVLLSDPRIGPELRARMN